jgi:hypothetical protein
MWKEWSHFIFVTSHFPPLISLDVRDLWKNSISRMYVYTYKEIYYEGLTDTFIEAEISRICHLQTRKLLAQFQSKFEVTRTGAANGISSRLSPQD